ncbi:hypothetical protein BDV59DRAFT_201516 [Aspergillus ambiguus]|uniref:uncharacterized protein n=1 Tax=Aspergillus ambiguus TaxID=176160 RepID=UPI003CCD7D9A
MSSEDVSDQRPKTPTTDTSHPFDSPEVENQHTHTVPMQHYVGVVEGGLDRTVQATQPGEGSTGVVQQLQKRIDELEELVRKQRATISNQSKAISDPRVVRRQHATVSGFPWTPRHGGPNLLPSPLETPLSIASGSVGSGVFNQPPPPFLLVQGNHPAPTAATEDLESSTANATAGEHHDCVLCSKMNGQYACAFVNFDDTFLEIWARLQTLWTKTESYGMTYANIPCIQVDSQMGQNVKDYVISLSDQAQASTLLGQPTTRYCLVAKAINYYLIKEVMKITAAKGFDASSDEEMGHIKQMMYPDTPQVVRQLIVVTLTSHLRELQEKPGFAEFSHHKARVHTNKLWQYVGPLTHDPFNQYTAWADLFAIVSEAQTLAIDMFSVPFEYKVDFPDMSETFEPTTMINRDLFIRGDPQGLKNNDTRVRLSITPIVRMRDNSQRPADIRMASLAHVLLRPAPIPRVTGK